MALMTSWWGQESLLFILTISSVFTKTLNGSENTILLFILHLFIDVF